MRKFCGKCFWKLARRDKDLNDEHMLRTILFQNVIVSMF